jgi:PKHD-type hydroxylase
MLLNIPDVLTADEVTQTRRLLEKADWKDGRITAGHQSALSKNNSQLSETDPIALNLGTLILKKLESTPLFLSAALPLKVYPPLFNRYAGGESFGTHVDNSIRQIPGSPFRMRCDLSCTLFLSDPSEYTGGELMIETSFGVQTVKLPSGSMILYPASSLHHVRPVSEGTRLASFFWVQSMVQDEGMRTSLFDMDRAIQTLVKDVGAEHSSIVGLTGVYHNLLRSMATL